MYKFEIHLHSNACSKCAISNSLEMIDAAYNHNYSGVVFTNHFYNGYTAVNKKLPWRDFVEEYNKDFLKAKEYGEQKNITVLFGLEEVYESGKEMLIYGLRPDIFASCEEFKSMSLAEKYSFVKSNGGITVCAHPFRVRRNIPNPNINPDSRYFDGVEGYNACNTEGENHKAVRFAKKQGKLITSGGDVHKSWRFGQSGIAFYDEVTTNEEFVKNLKSRKYKLIVNKKVIPIP